MSNLKYRSNINIMIYYTNVELLTILRTFTA